MFWDRDQLKKVTLDDLKRVASTYLIGSNRTVGEFIPTDHSERIAVGATPNITAMLQDYRGDAAQSAVSSSIPRPPTSSPESIGSRSAS